MRKQQTNKKNFLDYVYFFYRNCNLKNNNGAEEIDFSFFIILTLRAVVQKVHKIRRFREFREFLENIRVTIVARPTPPTRVSKTWM